MNTQELDALPEGSIVLTHPPMCLIKVGEDTRSLGGDWRSPYKMPGAPGEFRDSTYVAQVATRLLYNPSTKEGTS